MVCGGAPMCKRGAQWSCGIKWISGVLFLVLLLVEDVNPGELSFISKPSSVRYAACNEDVLLNWTYTSTRRATKISWYKLKNDGNTIEDRFARKDPGKEFTINTNSEFLPVRENRLEYLGNAVLKIKNIGVGDEGFVSCKLLSGLDYLESAVKLLVITPPIKSTSDEIPITIGQRGDASKHFLCNVTSRPPAEILWINSKGEHIEVNRGKYSTKEKSYLASCGSTVVENTLTILNISEHDAGHLKCVATVYIPTAVTLTQTIPLVIQYAPGSSSPTLFTITLRKKRANITCFSYSIPKPIYGIIKDGVALYSGSPPLGLPFTFVIDRVEFYHQGSYLCRSCNRFGCHDVTRALNITTPAEVWISPEPPLHVKVKDSLNIMCGFRGNPLQANSIGWRKVGHQSGNKIVQSKALRSSNSSITYRTTSLIIRSVTNTSFGVYRCFANNGFGEVYVDVEIYVQSHPTMQKIHPASTEMFFHEHHLTTFNCNATGFPKPLITWTVNNNPVPATSTRYIDPRSKGLWVVESTLVVNMTRDKAGVLQCIASNGLTPDVSYTKHLIVQYKPSISVTGDGFVSTIASNIQMFTVSLHDSVLLTCTATGHPKPVVNWTKRVGPNDEPIESETIETNHNYYFGVSSSLNILKVSADNNNEVYRCTARTASFGESHVTLKLLVLYGELTKRPPNPIFASVGSSVKFDWQFTYSQPLDYLVWQKGTSATRRNSKVMIGTVVGKAGHGTTTVKESRYVYDSFTKSGLTIHYLTESDEGWYQLIINFQNSPEVFTDSTYLLIATHPHNTTILPAGDVKAIESRNTTLTCFSYGKPPPLLSWYKGAGHDQAQLVNTSKYHIVFKVQLVPGEESAMESALLIMNLQVGDEGEYHCKGRTRVGTSESSKKVILHYAPKNTTLRPSSNPVPVNHTAILTCRTTSLTRVFYQYYFNKTLVRNTTNATYVVRNIQNYQEALYSCVPINFIGIDSEDTIMLSVSVPPTLISHDKLLMTTEGQSAQMKCLFYGDHPLTTSWLKTDVRGVQPRFNVTETVVFSNSTMMIKRSVLYIPHVALKEYGVYNCVAANRYGKVSQPVSLMVLDAVNITRHNFHMKTETHVYGSRMVKECVVSGFPKTISAVWTLNNHRIRPTLISKRIIEETAYFIRIQSVVTIPFVRKEDAGLLQCFVWNSLGNDTITTQINVKYPPELTGHPNIVEYVNLDSTLTLSCVTAANEVASILWYKENVRILKSTSTEIHVIQNPPQLISTLKIYPVSLDMQGSYTCAANNSLGGTNFKTSVIVLYPVAIKSYPPEILYANKTAANHTMRCHATGNPQPIITWYHSGSNIASDNKEYTVMTSSNDTELFSTLVIRKVRLADHGWWSCRAKNVIAHAEKMSDEKRFRLVVMFEATFASGFPKPIFTVNETYSVILRCLVKSSPKPRVWWTLPHNNTGTRHRLESKVVRDHDDYSVVEENLVITGVRRTDQGLYTCSANNTFVKVDHTSKLVVFFRATPDVNHTLHLHDGSILSLHSNAVSNPHSNFIFLINGTRVEEGVFTNVTKSRGNATQFEATQAVHVVKSEVRREESGVYVIKACNMIGCKVDQWDVYVQYQPVLLNSIPDPRVNASWEISFNCTYQAYPLQQPLITWTHGGENVSHGGKYVIRERVVYSSKYHYVVTSSLIIWNLTYLDSSNVACLANNGIGGISNASFDVFISYAPVNENTSLIENITFQGKESFHLSFKMLSNPSASFTWYKDNKTVSWLHNDVVMTSHPTKFSQTAQLSYPNATKDMSGAYHVAACNQLGCVRSHQMHVMVSYKPILKQLEAPLAEENTTATLTCSVEGQPSPSISWWFNGYSPLVNNTNASIAQTSEEKTYYTTVTSVLVLDRAQRTVHGGAYTCSADNAIGSSDNNASLIFRYIPMEVASFTSITIQKHEPFTLSYTVHSNPEASFTWLRNGNRINVVFTSSSVISRSEVATYKKSVVDVPSYNVTRYTGGVYTVVVTNALGNISYSNDVIVKYAPEITTSHDDVTILYKGTSSSLIVEIDSNPKPAVEWFRNDVRLQNSTWKNQVVVHDTYVEENKFRTFIKSIVTFLNVDKRYSGYYSCHAQNTIGKTTSRIHIIVYYAPVIKPDYPQRAFNATEFTLEKLCCHVDSNPVSTTLWFISRDATGLSSPVTGDIAITYKDTKNKLYEVAYESSLLFKPNNIERTDYGRYYCKATNVLGSTQSFTEINVLWRPEIALFKQIRGYKPAFVNAPISYRCEVQSNPVSVIDWQKDGVAINNRKFTTSTLAREKHKTVIESVLLLEKISVSDAGNYSCRARNDVGVNVTWKMLNVFHAPSTHAQNKNYTLMYNESAVLSCASTGYPPPSYKWYKDGVLLTHDEKYYTVVYSLRLERKLRHHYSCTPRNEVGSGKNVSYHVYVRAIPFITQPAFCMDNYTKADNVTRCSCNGVSLFPVSIFWTKLGKNAVLSKNSYLKVSAVGVNDGTYICHMKNDIGEITSLAAVARFSSQLSSWVGWSRCNNSCGDGYRYRTRKCVIAPCVGLTLKVTETCSTQCSHIPVINGQDDDGYIAIYVLVPISLVLVCLVCLWIVRANLPVDEDVVIIPVNEDTLHPPNRPQQIYVGHRGGYLTKGVAKEAIEVNLVFEGDRPRDREGVRNGVENGRKSPEVDLFTIMGISNTNYDASA